MGEYATYQGQSVKIGTCEDMLYLRYDQRHDVTPEPGSINPGHALQAELLRFRFPFPSEDGTEPGGFDDPFKGLAVPGVEAPEDIDHSQVQFKSTTVRGLLVMLPCPYSAEGKASGLHYGFNGYPGPVRIVQQAIRGGRLVTICECGGCGAKYRLPEFSDAEPIVAACRTEADRAMARDGGPDNPEPAAWRMWNTVADRITEGYTVSV